MNEYKHPSFHRTQTHFPHYAQIIVGIGTEFSRHLREATEKQFAGRCQTKEVEVMWRPALCKMIKYTQSYLLNNGYL